MNILKLFGKRHWLFFAIISFFLIYPFTGQAGFGISPPYVSNEYLSQGSHYEKEIVLVRGEPNEDLQVELSVDVPGANDWFSFNKGTSFTLPKGEKQVPLVVKVDVPNNADFGEYKGKINISTSSQEPSKGTVGIALGGDIDVKLKVIKGGILNFKINNVKISDAEENYSWLLWQVPTWINLGLQMENLGNIKSSPSKVLIDVYDNKEENIIETAEAIKIGKVDPFKTDWVTAKIPTKLESGNYWVRYRVYKNDEINKQGKMHLSVMPYGSLKSVNHNVIDDFSRLTSKDKIIASTLLLIIIIIVTALVWLVVRYTRKKKFFRH